MRQIFVLALVSLTVLSVSVLANENEKVKKEELLNQVRAALSLQKINAMSGDAEGKRHEQGAILRRILDRDFSMPIQNTAGVDRETLIKNRVESKIAQLKARYNLPQDFKLPEDFKIPESTKEHKLR